MIKTFIPEIEKQIASNQELYKQTNFEIFKERMQKLESLKGEILTQYENSYNKEIIFLKFNLRELRNKKVHI